MRLVVRLVAGALLLGFCLPGRQVAGDDRLTPIDIRQVRLAGEIGRRVEVTIRNNLLKIDSDNVFLKPYREKKQQRTHFIGLGKQIDCLVRFAAYTGDPDVVRLKQSVVDHTLRHQEPDGYIGYFPPELRMWTLWDTYEMGCLLYGLSTDYAYFGRQESLAAARKLADYMIARWSAEPERAAGGVGKLSDWASFLPEGVLLLYQHTSDPRYWDFCVKQRKLYEWDMPILLARRADHRAHVAGYFVGCRPQLLAYRVRPDDKLLESTRRAMTFLTGQDGMAVIGASGIGEHWDDSQASHARFGETCATAHLLWVLDEMLRLEGDSRYGDLMERTIFNALFAAQSPDGRRLRYFIPFQGPRAYYHRDDYCCPCNFRRIVADLPGMIYYRCDGGLAVNLYTASEAELPLDGARRLAVRQETTYPNSGRVVLHLSLAEEAEFPVRLRIPSWCGGAKVAAGDEPAAETPRPGSFLTLRRLWKPGDRIELQMPMPWRLIKGRKAQAGRVAVMRGPLVFCLNGSRHQGLGLPTDLGEVVIDPTSLDGPIRDATVRPDGLACRVRAFRPDRHPASAKADLELLLTEFADPGGEATFLLVPDPGAGELVDDELIRPGLFR